MIKRRIDTRDASDDTAGLLDTKSHESANIVGPHVRSTEP